MAAKNELVPLNILIADRTYRVKANPSDEEHVRKTVKLINDKIIEFKTQFAGKDMQDYVSMVMIWYATQAAAQANQMAPVEEISTGLRELEEQLDRLILS
jgi:cell division protein ZapA